MYLYMWGEAGKELSGDSASLSYRATVHTSGGVDRLGQVIHSGL